MAQPFTLKLGNVDLSNYVRLAPGEGFDPMGSQGFVTPGFVDAPLAEGMLLTNLDAGNREMAWPLHLNAVDKDTVHALVRSINNEVANNPQLRVEWKDQGATFSTFYDVAFARFDPEFDYRKAANNWESGVLRVWCSPPFGHTGTTRIVATGLTPSAMSPVAVVPLPSMIGDAMAQPIYRITATQSGATNSGYAYRPQQVAAVAVLPHASYIAWWPAASFVNTPPVGATWAYGSQIFASGGTTTGQRNVSISVQLTATGYTGRNRVFALVNCQVASTAATSVATVVVYATDQQFQLLGPTSAFQQTDVPHSWGEYQRMVDLGVMSMPSWARFPTINVLARIPGGVAQVATVGIGGLVIVPDDALVYTDLFSALASLSVGLPVLKAASVALDGTGKDDSAWATIDVTNTQFTPNVQGDYSLDSVRRGRVPRIPPSATTTLAIIGHMPPGSGFAQVPLAFQVYARERFQFAR